MSNAQIDICGEVRLERRRQDRKWGGPAHDNRHSLADWARFITDHLQRATTARQAGDIAGARYQMVRVAALAVAAIEACDRQHPGARHG